MTFIIDVVGVIYAGQAMFIIRASETAFIEVWAEVADRIFEVVMIIEAGEADRSEFACQAALKFGSA